MRYKPKKQVTPRQLEYCGVLIEDYVHTIHNAIDYFGIHRRNVYRHLERLEEAKYISHSGEFFMATRRAHIELRSPYRWHVLGWMRLEHWCNVISVREHLRRDERFIVLGWTGERAIRRQLGLPDSYPDHTMIIPDAVATLMSVANRKPVDVAIEVERSHKQFHRLRDKLERLAAEYESIFYFAAGGYVYELVESCIQSLPRAQYAKFALWNLDTILVSEKPKERTQV